MCINNQGAWDRGQRADCCVPRSGTHYTAARHGCENHLYPALCTLSSERGISLVELIMFIVIVSVGLAGILLVMDVATKSSADPVIRKQALTIVESLLDEIELKSFILGPYVGADRSQFDDIFDYNGLSGAVTHANSSVAVTGLENYSVRVVVVSGVAALPVIPAANAALITVTINGPGGQEVEMAGYRVAY